AGGTWRVPVFGQRGASSSCTGQILGAAEPELSGAGQIQGLSRLSVIKQSEKSPAASLVIGRKDFQRIKEAARVLTKEEREAKLAALRAEKKAVLVGISPLLAWRPGALLSPQLILGAKCHMIRDTQILEKQLITREREEEEKRLARMMEVERKRADEVQEELERRRKQELIRGRQELVKQIEQNAEERALRAEQRDQEAQEVREYLEQLKMEDMKDLKQRQEQQKRIQAEIKRINDENQRLKEEQREQERMADERVLEYQRRTMEREAEFEAEQERIRWEKEKETARLRAMQQRAQDLQAEQVSGFGRLLPWFPACP
uniref:Cilia- and flagella-associated protein 45 n=1 Tax=Bubo bubo TaxID=30461 RepID=A0A8C0I7Z8_BUBBB